MPLDRVETAEISWSTFELSEAGQKFINGDALRAFVNVLMGQSSTPIPENIFCFETIIRALYDGFSLDGIAQTAAAQLTTGIIFETLALANGNTAMTARLLQIDEIELEDWIFSNSQVLSERVPFSLS